jgi:hypothetical protein
MCHAEQEQDAQRRQQRTDMDVSEQVHHFVAGLVGP